jgi:hypothetical protein
MNNPAIEQATTRKRSKRFIKVLLHDVMIERVNGTGTVPAGDMAYTTG